MHRNLGASVLALPRNVLLGGFQLSNMLINELYGTQYALAYNIYAAPATCFHQNEELYPVQARINVSRGRKQKSSGGSKPLPG